MTREHRVREKKNNSRGKGLGQLAIIAGNLLFGLMLLIVVMLAFSLVRGKLSGQPPQVFGHRMYIVLSGSMQPAFNTGSLVLVRPVAPAEIRNGDIITYRGLGGKEQLVSHRVVTVNDSNQGISFTTKGDANEATDPNPVAGKNLIGKVILAIPYLGYLMEYVRTKQGVFLVVIIPSMFLLIYELMGLSRRSRTGKKGKHLRFKS